MLPVLSLFHLGTAQFAKCLAACKWKTALRAGADLALCGDLVSELVLFFIIPAALLDSHYLLSQTLTFPVLVKSVEL